MSKRKISLIVVIPIGPKCAVENILDTVDSVRAYATSERRIILVDDSQRDTARQVADQRPDEPIDILVTPRNQGHGGGLFLSLCLAYAHAVDHYRFDALLRLDTDALVIGPEPQQTAITAFRQNPRLAVGGWLLIGNRTSEQHLGQLVGNRALASRIADWLRRPYSSFRLRRVFQCLAVRRLYRRAAAHAYTGADYVFGGTYFLSETFLRRLRRMRLLGSRALGGLDLEEDQIFGLLAKALDMENAAMQHSDFQSGEPSPPDMPFACEWKCLPAAPEDLVRTGRKIAHSTRGWDGMTEREVRAFFRERRPIGTKTTK